MLTLAYPWLLAVLPLPLLAWWFGPPYRESREALRVPFVPRLARLTGQEPAPGAVVLRGGWLRTLALTGAWLCVVAALVRPQWLEPPISRIIPVRDMMLAIDLSGSMGTTDFTESNGKTVDRLTAVKQVLDDFLTRRKGDRVGLIVFGNAPFVQAPFTQDLSVCRELLSETQVGMAGPKTAFGDAIGLAITVFDRSQVPEKVLIALTDGNDTGSQVPPEKAAAVARDKHIVIHTVAVGDPKAAGEDKLDEAALKRVASDTGGTYSHAGSRAELEATYTRLDALPTREATAVTNRPRRDLFQWPLAIGLALSYLPAAAGLIVAQVRKPKSRAPRSRAA
jgi:Ca-activated chloride channel family protein